VINAIGIFKVEQEEDGILVTFSDGTIAGYVTEELLEWRPNREPATEIVDRSEVSVSAG
jgi:hypothetical protein